MAAEKGVMKCEWYQRWLTVSADDELTGWRAALLRRHLSLCADCTLQLAGLRRIRQFVAGQKAHYLASLDDRYFWQQLHAQLQGPQAGNLRARSGVESSRPFSMHWVARAAVAAVALLVALAGVQVFRSSPNHQLAFDLPLLPPLGKNRVEFAELASVRGTSASVVKFDRPDTDIAVIWVDGLSGQ
jgi:Putative zinc-finger